MKMKEKVKENKNEIPIEVLDYIESIGYFVCQLNELAKSFKPSVRINGYEDIYTYLEIPIEGFDIIAGSPKESIIPMMNACLNKWIDDYNSIDLSNVDNYTLDLIRRMSPSLPIVCLIRKANEEFEKDPNSAMKKYLRCDL